MKKKFEIINITLKEKCNNSTDYNNIMYEYVCMSKWQEWGIKNYRLQNKIILKI